MKTLFSIILSLISVTLLLQANTAVAAEDSCIKGYVWREAFSGDHVCVTPAIRSQVIEDNRNAKLRFQPGGGAYGPDTCRPGFVWRDARNGDHVCVTPATRSQAAEDNRLADSRIARSVSFPQAIAAQQQAAQVQPQAREIVIECPLQQVSVDITSRLPSPWWSTEQGGNLVDTEMFRMGDKMILACLYRAYDGKAAVIREMPSEVSSCSPQRNGFRCR